MKRLFLLFAICLIFNCLSAQKPLSLASSFYNTLNNYVLYNDHIEYQKLMNMCDAGFRVSDRFAQEQTDIPSLSLLLQNYLELLRDKQVKLAITDMREITLSNHRTEGAPTKTVLVNVTFSSPKTSTYKLQNVVYIRNNKIFCIGDYEVDKSGKVLTDIVNKTNRTSTNNNIHNGHEYVDLGLSVMWANRNVGAGTPEDYGDYFAWGEVVPKEIYNWSTYLHCDGTEVTITKYNTSSSYGTVDNKTELKAEDDAASVNWGGDWRMPTDEEMTELRENCIWIWTSQNEVNGYKITGPNGNSIFLPAGGCYNKNKFLLAGTLGDYWCSSLCEENPNSAYNLDFASNRVEKDTDPRNYGRTIRPVYSLH